MKIIIISLAVIAGVFGSASCVVSELSRTVAEMQAQRVAP